MKKNKNEREHERRGERKKKKLPRLNPSGNVATPLINYEKTELGGGGGGGGGGAWRGSESVCLAAAREEPDFLNSSKQTLHWHWVLTALICLLGKSLVATAFYMRVCV